MRGTCPLQALFPLSLFATLVVLFTSSIFCYFFVFFRKTPYDAFFFLVLFQFSRFGFCYSSCSASVIAVASNISLFLIYSPVYNAFDLLTHSLPFRLSKYLFFSIFFFFYFIFSAQVVIINVCFLKWYMVIL